MSYFLLAITFTISFFGSIKNRVLQNIGGISLFITMFIVMAFNYENADIDTYEIIYDNIDFLLTGDLDITSISSLKYFFSTVRNFGFLYTNKFFNNIGFSFSEFHFIISLILLGCIFIFVKKMTPNYGMVMLLYFVYPFSYDIIQVKNFYVEVIILIVLYVYSKKKRFYDLKYIFIILGASTFHNIALIYLPFFIVKKICKSLLFRLIVIGIVGIFPFIASMIKNWSGNLISLLAISSESFEHYSLYSDWSVGIIYLLHWGMTIFVIMILFYLYQQILKAEIRKEIPLMVCNYFEVTYMMWLYLCCFVPLFAISIDSYRITRNVFLPLYICVANYSYYGLKNSRLIYISCLLAVGLYAYLVLPKGIVTLGLIPVPDISTITEILDYNYVFDYFN
jgi:hypothetical protein